MRHDFVTIPRERHYLMSPLQVTSRKGMLAFFACKVQVARTHEVSPDMFS